MGYLGGKYGCSDEEKILLGKEYFEKIKLSVGVFIVIVNNYNGESTTKEIECVKSLDKLYIIQI